MRSLVTLWCLALLAACGVGRQGPRDVGVFSVDSGVPHDGGTDVDAGPNLAIQAGFVIDGDTVRLSAAAAMRTPDNRPMTGESVRLLGIDAPEIAHPPNPADCWGDEAHARARELMQGRIIELSYDLDPSCTLPIAPARAEDCRLRDQFGRLLAYITLASDGTVVNERLIREGHARSFRRYPHRFTAQYNAAEDQARNARLGLWSCP